MPDTAPRVRDTFCSYCGARYPEPLAGYPRVCTSCRAAVWANPLPVNVVIVPVVDGARTAVLVIRRNIEPHRGKLALPGGFLEEHEPWAVGAVREVREETGVEIDPDLEQLLWRSSGPRPNRLMMFSVARPIAASALPPHHADAETQERGVIYGPDGLEDVFGFATHIEATRRYFAREAITGPHAFTPR